MPGNRRVLFVLGCLGWFVVPAYGDSGTLRSTIRTGRLSISIFTDSSPSTGLLDVNVLVQTIPTGSKAPLPGIRVSAYPDGAPERSECGPSIIAPAYDKVFVAAQLELTEPGKWHFDVEVDDDRPANGEFDLLVEEGDPRGTNYALWVSLPLAGVFLYAIHRRRVIRIRSLRERTNANPPQGGS